MKRFAVLLIGALLLAELTKAQAPNNEPKTATQVRKFSYVAVAAFWARHTQLNPESTVMGQPKSSIADVSIRRLRLVGHGYLFPDLFVKISLGVTNHNSITKNADLMLLDMYAKYEHRKWLKIGMGKTDYTGFSRYSAVGTSSLITLEIPVMALPTVNISDDFTRQFAIFAEGHVGKFDYTLVMARPLAVTRDLPNDEHANFATDNSNWQPSGYLVYNFLDQESQKGSTGVGSYLGQKNILNLGIGYLYQKDAMAIQNGENLDYHDMKLFAIDAMLDKPLDTENKRSITWYTAYFNTDYGPNYIRNVGINNPGNGSSGDSYLGHGNSYPTMGTGQSVYSQFAIRFNTSKDNPSQGIMPFVAGHLADFDYLNNRMFLLEYGLNYLFDGHNSKLTLGVQHRPIFKYDENRRPIYDQRKSMVILQYLVKFKG